MELKDHLAGLLLKPCPICSMMKDIWPNYRFSLTSQSMKKKSGLLHIQGVVCLISWLVVVHRDSPDKNKHVSDQTSSYRIRSDQTRTDENRNHQTRTDQTRLDQTRPDQKGLYRQVQIDMPK